MKLQVVYSLPLYHMQPKVSIIIPVYNSECFIPKAILSLLNQTYTNIEIIIVDDSSVDASYTIAKSFESAKVQVYRQENAGAAIARNKGLKHATGKYVQFMDVDDFLSADKIEKQVKALEGNENAVAVCDYINFFDEIELKEGIRKIDQSSYIYSSDSPVNFLINLYGGNGGAHFIQTNSWLTPRKLIEEVGGWRNYRCPDDDGEFFARVLLASKSIVYVPGVYNYYRRSTKESSLSNNKNKKYIQNTLLTIDLKYKYLDQKDDNASFQKAMAIQYLNFAVSAYPRHKLLSQIAFNRYKKIGVPAFTPKLGGTLVELIKNMLGWKTARLLKYYFREKQ